MTRTLAVDPGDATGLVEGWYDDESPWRPTAEWIVRGGARGLARFLAERIEGGLLEPELIVCERFEPDGSPGGRMTTSPRGEGVLEMAFVHGPEIFYQDRSQKTVGMRDRPTADARLRALGLWTEGVDVDHTDGRDANDCKLHMFWHMRHIRHMPTLRFWSTPPGLKTWD